MVYQQCGPVCPETCDNDDSAQCPSGCVEGCFCPTGMVLSNGQCINEGDCEGTKNILYHYMIRLTCGIKLMQCILIMLH